MVVPEQVGGPAGAAWSGGVGGVGRAAGGRGRRAGRRPAGVLDQHLPVPLADRGAQPRRRAARLPGALQPAVPLYTGACGFVAAAQSALLRH